MSAALQICNAADMCLRVEDRRRVVPKIYILTETCSITDLLACPSVHSDESVCHGPHCFRL